MKQAGGLTPSINIVPLRSKPAGAARGSRAFFMSPAIQQRTGNPAALFGAPATPPVRLPETPAVFRLQTCAGRSPAPTTDFKSGFSYIK